MSRTSPIRLALAALLALFALSVLLPEPVAPLAQAQDGEGNGDDQRERERRLRERLERERWHNLWRVARLERERHWQIGSTLLDAGFLDFAAQFLRTAADPLATVPSDVGFVAVHTGDLDIGERAYRRLAAIERARDEPRRTLDRATARERDGRPGAAYQTLVSAYRLRAPASELAPALAEAARRIAVLEERAQAHVERAFEALEQEDAQALGRLLDEARANWQEFEGFVGARLAWRRLVSDPRVAALEREREAAAAWSQARRLLSARPGVRALDAVESVARRYRDTPAGEVAAERLEQLREDPEFMETVNAERARTLFSRAENFRRNRLLERAQELYEEYLAEYPNGADAQAARRALAEIGDI